MKFESEYIQKCHKAFLGSKIYYELEKALEEGNENDVRIHMDYGIDELQEEVNQKVGTNGGSIHDVRVEKLELRQSCWYDLHEFIELFDEQRVLQQERSK